MSVRALVCASSGKSVLSLRIISTNASTVYVVTLMHVYISMRIKFEWNSLAQWQESCFACNVASG